MYNVSIMYTTKLKTFIHSEFLCKVTLNERAIMLQRPNNFYFYH